MNQLWVWSTAVQTTSLLMIAVFFAVLARSVKLAPVSHLGGRLALQSLRARS